MDKKKSVNNVFIIYFTLSAYIFNVITIKKQQANYQLMNKIFVAAFVNPF